MSKVGRIVWGFTVLLSCTDSPAACFSPKPATSHQKSHSRVVQSLGGRIFHLSFLCWCSYGFEYSNVMGRSRTTPFALLLFTPYFVVIGLH